MLVLVSRPLLEPTVFYCGQAPHVEPRSELPCFYPPESQPAPEPCFQKMNSVGNSQGHCGQDSKGSFLPCAQR